MCETMFVLVIIIITNQQQIHTYMFVLVHCVASQLVTNTITQCQINSLNCKMISVLALASCFNKFIMSDLLGYNLIPVLVLTSHTNNSTSLGSTLFYTSKLFLSGIKLLSTYVQLAFYLCIITLAKLFCFTFHSTIERSHMQLKFRCFGNFGHLSKYIICQFWCDILHQTCLPIKPCISW